MSKLTPEELKALKEKALLVDPVLQPEVYDALHSFSKRDSKSTFEHFKEESKIQPFFQTGEFFEPHGDSRYDEGTPLDAVLSDHGITDWRAQQQPIVHKWANVATNFGTVATTSFINNTVGGVWGLAEGLLTWDKSRIVNNEIAKLVQDVQEAVSEAMPLYRSQGEMELPWWNQLGKANFWGDVVISQGFTAGVIAAMAVTGGVIGAAQRGMRGYRLSKGAFELGTKGQYAPFIKQFTTQGVNYQNAKLATDALIKAGNVTKRSDAVRTMLSSVYSSHGYATTEAISHTRQLEKEFKDNYENLYRESLPTVTENIRREILANDPFISEQELAVELDRRIEEDYQAGLEEIDRLLNNKRNLNYLLNLGYLTLTNATAWGSFATGNYSTMKSIQQSMVRLKDPSNLRAGVEAIRLSPYQQATRIGKRIFKNPMIQFAEETSLHINRESTADFYRSQYDPEGTKNFTGFMEAYLERGFNTLTDPVEWESGVRGFIGGLLGGIGPRVRSGKLTGVEGRGGLFEVHTAFKEATGFNNQAQKQATMVNDILQDDRIRAMHLAAIRSNVINNRKENAVFLNDKFQFDNATADEFLNSLFLFDDLGLQDQFLELIGVGENITAEQIREAFTQKIDTDGIQLESPIDPLLGVSDEDIVKNARETTKELQTLAKKILDNKNNVESLLVHRGFEGYTGLRNQLLYYMGSIDNMQRRAQEVTSKFTGDLTAIPGLVAQLVDANINKNERVFAETAKAIEDIFKTIDTVDADSMGLDSNFNELLGLSYRAAHFKKLYEGLLTQEGADQFMAEVVKAEEEAAAREVSNTQTGAEATDNPQAVSNEFKPIVESTLLKETIKDSKNPKLQTSTVHKGKLALELQDRDGNKRTIEAEVQGITKEGYLHLIHTKNGKTTDLFVDSNFRLLFKRDNQYIISKEALSSFNIVETATQVRDRFHQRLFAEAVREIRGDLTTKIENGRNQLKQIQSTFERVDSAIAKALQNKSNTIRPKDATLKDDIKNYLGITIPHVIALSQLEALKNRLVELKESIQNDINEAEAVIAREYEGFTPESWLEIDNLIREEVDNANTIIKSSDDLIERLSKRIANLKRNIGGMYTFLRNKLQELESQHQEFEDLGLDDIFDGKRSISRAHLNTAVDIISNTPDITEQLDTIQKGIEARENNLRKAERELEDAKKELAEAKQDLQNLQEGIKIRESYLSQYNALLRGKFFSKAKAATKQNVDGKPLSTPIQEANAVKENTAETSIEIQHPPAHPFTGRTSELFVTTAAEQEFQKNPKLYEPQLKFQRKLESIDPSETNLKLKLVSRKVLTTNAKYKDLLTEELIDQLNSYEEEGVFVVLHNSDDTVYSENSLFNPDSKTLLLSAIHEAAQENGKWVNKRKNSGFPIVAEDYYVKYRSHKDRNLPINFAEDFHKAYDEFNNNIKKAVLENGESGLLDITGITPGKIVDGEQYNTAETILGNKEFGNIKIVLGTGKPIALAGRNFDLEDGMAKAFYRNRLFNLQRASLNAEDVGNVIGLFQKYFMDNGGDALLNSIDNLTFLLYKPVEKKNRTEHTLYVETDSNNNPSKIVFGKTSEITKEQLLTRDSEKIREFEDFLSKKYYNIKEAALNDPGNFTLSLPQVLYDADGNISSVEISDKTWTSYNEYLMSSDAPKITINLPKATETEIQQLSEAPVINRALEYNVPIVESKPIDKGSNDVIVKEPVTSKAVVADAKSLIGLDPSKKVDSTLADEVLSEYAEETTALTQEDIVKMLDTRLEDADIDINSLEKKQEEVNKQIEEAQKKTKEEAVKEREETASAFENFRASNVKKTLKSPDRNTQIKTQAEQEIKNLVEMFPNLEALKRNLTVEALMEIKNGKLKVLINPIGVEGRAYHEAFHIIEEVFLPIADKTTLYNDTRKRLGNRKYTVEGKEVVGKDMTDSQVSEFLAEEYREYRLTGKENYKFAGNQTLTRRFFNWLDGVINKLLNFFGLGYAVNTKYADMSKAERLFREWDGVQKEIPDIINTPNVTKARIGDLTSDESRAVFNHFNYLFFDIFHTDPEFKDVYFENITGEVLDSLYDKVFWKMGNRIRSVAQEDSHVLHKLKPSDATAILNKHSKFLNQFKINVDLKVAVENEVNTEGVEIPTQFIESMFVNVKDNARSEVKFLVAGLPNVKRDNLGNPVIASEKGLEGTANFPTTFGMLHRHLSNLPTYEAMIEKLESLSDKFPVYKTLLHRLGSSTNNVRQHNSRKQEDLRIAFFKQFSKATNSFIQGIFNEDGQMYFLDATENSAERKIRDLWLSNAKKDSNPVFTLKDNEYVLNMNKKVSIAGSPTMALRAFVNPDSKGTSINDFNRNFRGPQERIQAYKDFLGLFGIEVPQQYALSYTSEYKSEVELLANVTGLLISELRQNAKETITLEDIFNPDKFKINDVLKRLSQDFVDYGAEFTSNSYYDKYGRHSYALMLPSKLTSDIQNLNYHAKRGTLPADLIPFKDGQGNLGTVNSLWIEHFRKGKTVDSDILRAYGIEGVEKEDIKDLKPGDFAVAELNSVLAGRFPFLRSAERGTEHMFGFGHEYVSRFYREHLKDHSSRVNLLKGYLRAEVLKALAHNSIPEFGHLTKNESYKGLSFFEKILPEFNEVIKKQPPVEDLTMLESTANNLINNNTRIIDSRIGEYIVSEKNNTRNFLIDINVLKKIGDNKWNFEVLNENILSRLSPARASAIESGKFNVKNLTDDQLTDVLHTFNLLYIHSTLEQTKLFLGDVKQFTKGNSNDLFKRTTLYTANKETLTNDARHIEILNKRVPRMDGTLHTENTRTLAVSDHLETSIYYPFINKILQKAFKESAKAYEGINSSDASADFTLDGSHRYQISAGIITPAKERTLLYQKQFLYRWIMNNKEHDILKNIPKSLLDKFNEDNFKKIYKDHLPKDYNPNNMYFEGQTVAYNQLSPVEVVKPQLVGRIQNDLVKGSNAFANGKFSINTPMPTELIRPDGTYSNKFATLVYATILGADMIAPRSSNKNEELGNKNGQLTSLYNDNGAASNLTELFNKEFPIRLTSWTDLGHQLDIDPSGKTSVTQSIQMKKLIPIDMYKNGTIRDEFKKYETLVEESHNIVRQIVEKDLKTFFDNLGLVAKEDGKISLEDKNKFVNAIIDAIEAREQPDNVADSISYLMEQAIKYFETLPTQRQIKNLIQGMVRNKVIKTKVTGDMLVLVSPVGYERTAKIKGPNNTWITSSEHLKYYRPLTKDGEEIEFSELKNIELKDIAKVGAAQAMVSLKKEWVPAIMKDLKRPEGKSFTRQDLAEFNAKMMDTNWEHYDKWKNIRTILVNRTPAQHLNSIDVLEIVEFMGFESGPKIVIPAELVAKTGADFDIDKVTAYFNNLTISEDGNISFNTEGRAGLENRLNDIYKQLLLAPENFASLIRPNNSEFIKKLAGEVKNAEKESSNISEMLTFKYNAKTARNYWEPNKLIGTTAIIMTSHPVLQQFNVTIADDIFESFFESFKGTEGRYNFGHYTDQKNNIISNINGDIGTAVVDAGKENIPSITKIGYNLRTAYAYHALNMLGRGETRPVDFATLTKFFSHPIVIALNKRLDNSEAMFNNFTDEKFHQKKNHIVNTLNEVGLNLSVKGHRFLYESMRDFLKAEGNNVQKTKTNLTNHINSFKTNNRYINDAVLNSSDPQDILTVAELYLYYIEAGKVLKMLTDITRPDANLDKNRSGVKIKQERYRTLLELGIFNKEELDNLMDKSYLGAYQEVHNQSYQAFNEFDAVTDMTSTEDVMWGTRKANGTRNNNGLMSSFMNRELAKSVEDLIQINQKLSNALVNYLLHTTPHPKTQKPLTEYYREYITGKNSIAKLHKKLRAKYGENPFLSNTIAKENEYLKRDGVYRGYDYIKFTGDKLTVDESNAVTEGIMDLMTHSDPDAQLLGKLITIQSLIQSGIQVSPHSFFEFIPAKPYQTKLQNLLWNYKNNYGPKHGLDLQLVKRIIFNNFRDDRQLVPRVSEKFIVGKDRRGLAIPEHHQNARYEYLAVEINDGTTQKPIYKRLLYERTNIIDAENGKEFYRLIPSRGDRYTMFNANTKGLTRDVIPYPVERREPVVKEYTVTAHNTVDENNPQYEGMPEFNKLPAHDPTKKTMAYAGIGSRKTPPKILSQMKEVSKELAKKGYTLRSGAAIGADKAFEAGATKKEIFKTTDATPRTKAIAREIHPVPAALSGVGLDLMARNTNQIFGKNLDSPVDFVLAWTPDGLTDYSKRTRESGGTGQAIDMASRKNIPVINLANPNWREQLDAVLAQQTSPTTTQTVVAPRVDTSASWSNLKTQPVYTEQGVNTMRTSNKEAEYAHFGNPFSEGGYSGTIKTKTVEEAWQNYKDWLLNNKYNNVKPEQRQWILEQINSGKLDNATLLYDSKLAARGLGTHAHALAEVVQELRGTAGEEMAQLDTGRRINLSEIEADKKLINSLQDVWNTLGINVSKVDTIMMDGREIGATAKSNVIARLVEYVDGKRDITTLPEETAHIVVRMIQGTPIYKAMYSDIVNTDFYNEVVDNYSNTYSGDDLMLREEAMGKAIAEAMVVENRRRLEQSNWSTVEKWLRGVIRAIKEMFKQAKTNPYHEAAVRILDNNLTDLVNKAETAVGQEVMFQDRLSVQDDYAEAMRQQRLHQNELEQNKFNRDSEVNKLFRGEVVDIAEADRAQLAQSEADMLASEERVIEANKTELKKVSQPKTKQGVSELFESNPELANDVYVALGTNQNIVEIFEGFWNRQQVALQTDKVFLFGDNTNDRTITKYVPSATQAVIRGLSNAIGIDTKKDRGTLSSSYLTDNDFEWFKNHVDEQIQKAKDSGKTIVIPADGIGTGKAMLKEKAPKLFEYLQQKLNELKNNQITPQQKQQAQLAYSQYLNTTNNPTIQGFKEFVQGKQFQKLTEEEKARTIEQVTKEHRSITALKDLSAKLAHRIGGTVEFKNRTNVDWKGYNQGMTSVLNEAYMTPDTPFHEILAHPIIRAIKKSKPELYQSLLKELEYGKGKEVLDRIKRDYVIKKQAPEKNNDYDYEGYIYTQRGANFSRYNKETGTFEETTVEKHLEALDNYYNTNKVKYTLEEQQEEAIVTLLGLMAADKLDAKKDATLISKLKELWKQISDFVKSLLRQDGIIIDELPITTTLNDLAEIMAYGNNKIILPGYKVEYSTPLGNKYDTLEEVNQEIRGLADANVEVDLSGVKIPITKINTIEDVKNLIKSGQMSFVFGDISYIDGEFIGRTLTDKEGQKIPDEEVIAEAKRVKRKSEIETFIEKNKEYEQAKEIIEQWKKENNIQYDPEEVYSRGQGFYSSIGAYSDLELDLLLKNLIQHIQDNKKAGGEFTISAFTKPIDKRLKHIEGTGSRIRFVIYPKSEHIKWAAPTDVYSGSVWDAHEKVSKDKKSELLGVSFTKAPALRNINEVSPNLADIIDNLSHHHNELGIELTTNNFRIEYDDNIDYSTKKLIDNINKILDDKYGKLVKPEVKKQGEKIVQYGLYSKGANDILDWFDTKEEAQAVVDKLNKQLIDLGESPDYLVRPITKAIGKQPTQTKENTTSIESVKDKIDKENYSKYGGQEAEEGMEFIYPEKHNKKEYTSQALTNLKIAALKEVARKYPRSLITSKVVPINPNLVDNSEIQYSKVGSKQDIEGFKEFVSKSTPQLGTQLEMDFTREQIISEQLLKFNKFYPNFADNIRSEDARRSFIEDVMDGKIKIIC